MSVALAYAGGPTQADFWKLGSAATSRTTKPLKMGNGETLLWSLTCTSVQDIREALWEVDSGYASF